MTAIMTTAMPTRPHRKKWKSAKRAGNSRSEDRSLSKRRNCFQWYSRSSFSKVLRNTSC